MPKSINTIDYKTHINQEKETKEIACYKQKEMQYAKQTIARELMSELYKIRKIEKKEARDFYLKFHCLWKETCAQARAPSVSSNIDFKKNTL